jgi:hypothetical protein
MAVGSDDRAKADGCASGSASVVRAPGLAAPPSSYRRTEVQSQN